MNRFNVATLVPSFPGATLLAFVSLIPLYLATMQQSELPIAWLIIGALVILFFILAIIVIGVTVFFLMRRRKARQALPESATAVSAAKPLPTYAPASMPEVPLPEFSPRSVFGP